MATGYTCVIVDRPEITFREFALRCSRAFGALVDMRDVGIDAPPPEKVEPSTYHRDALERAYAKMRELEVMSLDEADRRAEEDHERQLQTKRDGEARLARETELYRAMLAKVEAWAPPTDDHVGLKRFMAEQIETSMPVPYDWPAHRMTAQTWLDHAREQAAHDIEYHAKHWKEDQERANRATAWVKALRESLPTADADPKGGT